jgi:hypothetical protein
MPMACLATHTSVAVKPRLKRTGSRCRRVLRLGYVTCEGRATILRGKGPTTLMNYLLKRSAEPEASTPSS